MSRSLVTEHKQINVTNNQRIYLYLKFLDRKVFVELLLLELR